MIATTATSQDIERGWSRISEAMTASERHTSDSAFFSGGPASAKARDYLRSLLAQSSDAELVNDLRAFFNDLRVGGDTIARPWVSAAIRLLKK